MSPLIRHSGPFARLAGRLVAFLQDADSTQLQFAGCASCAIIGGFLLYIPLGRAARLADWLEQLCAKVSEASNNGLVNVGTSHTSPIPAELLPLALARVRGIRDTTMNWFNLSTAGSCLPSCVAPVGIGCANNPYMGPTTNPGFTNLMPTKRLFHLQDGRQEPALRGLSSST